MGRGGGKRLVRSPGVSSVAPSRTDHKAGSRQGQVASVSIVQVLGLCPLQPCEQRTWAGGASTLHPPPGAGGTGGRPGLRAGGSGDSCPWVDGKPASVVS